MRSIADGSFLAGSFIQLLRGFRRGWLIAIVESKTYAYGRLNVHISLSDEPPTLK
jgi:hypothetical protein